MAKQSSSITVRSLLQAEQELMGSLIERAEAEESSDTQELLEIVRDMLGPKADGLAVVAMDTLPTYIATLKAKARMYDEAAKSADRALTRLKSYIQFVMEEQGIAKLDGGEYTIKLTNNSQPSVEIAPEVDQHKYVNTDMITTRIEYAWDKSVLKQMAADDPESLPPGIRVIRGKHIRIGLTKK